MRTRISIRIENRERYVIDLDKARFVTPKDFIEYTCKKFMLEVKPTYVLLLEPSSIIYDINVITHNDKLRLVERSKLQLLLSEEQLI